MERAIKVRMARTVVSDIVPGGTWCLHEVVLKFSFYNLVFHNTSIKLDKSYINILYSVKTKNKIIIFII